MFGRKRKDEVDTTAEDLAVALARLEDSKTEIARLQVQIEKLQSALVAQASPEFYRDSTGVSRVEQAVLDEVTREMELRRVMSRYSEIAESDQLIQSQADLEALLVRATGMPASKAVQPQNSES